jgi:hypothetical protein
MLAVRLHNMRSLRLTGLLIGLALAGCGEKQDTRPGSVPATPTNAVPNTRAVSSIEGTWHWRDAKMLVELSADGRWLWWNLEEQSGRSSEPPLMNGKWFIRDDALYLRIEHHAEGGGHGVSPGMAMVFDVKAVDPQLLHLGWAMQKEEITWKRIAEPDGAADQSQPVRAETNQTSAAAGPGR